jgi:NAD(P)-dependent dehydrogenase (short-subunit alcohol dehydrogenase family)
MRVLKDRVAVVTGGASGIGRAMAHEFARAGMDVVLADVNEALLSGVADEVRALGRRAVTVVTDVRDLAAIEALLARTLSEFGACHLVANKAGVFHAAAMIEAPASEWQRVVDTNLWGVIHGSRVFGAHFAAQHEGHIVNTASAAGLFPVPGMSSYSTTKFAIVGASLQLRWELDADGVGVTVLCPGVVKTGIGTAKGAGLEHIDMTAAVAKSPDPEGLARKVVRAVRKNSPMVRYGADAYFFSLLRLLPLWLLDPLGRFMGRTALKVVRPPALPVKASESGSLGA